MNYLAIHLNIQQSVIFYRHWNILSTFIKSVHMIYTGLYVSVLVN